MDTQGRILIPVYLRQYASLEKDVVIAGGGHKFEIWDKDVFETTRKELEANIDTDMTVLAEQGFELRL